MNLFARDFLVPFFPSSPAIIGIICQLGGTWLFVLGLECVRNLQSIYYDVMWLAHKVLEMKSLLFYFIILFWQPKTGWWLWCYTSQRVSLWYFPAPMRIDVLLLYGDIITRLLLLLTDERRSRPLVLFNIGKRSQDPFQFLLVNCWHPRCVTVCVPKMRVMLSISFWRHLYQPSFGS
jgi:hypothetical protein